MTDKPILIGLKGLEGLSPNIALVLAERGLREEDVIIIDATDCNSMEDLKKAIEEGSGKTIVIEDVGKMLNDSKPRDVEFKLTAMPRLKEEFITLKDLESYHSFSKFTKNKRKKW